ncbi:MAG TPA: hypothetical protein VMV46_07710 [Thermoanaerobaculia bacterium]|nr:hypothetical protein [Thermoanaerobaculia bacterium]
MVASSSSEIETFAALELRRRVNERLDAVRAARRERGEAFEPGPRKRHTALFVVPGVNGCVPYHPEAVLSDLPAGVPSDVACYFSATASAQGKLVEVETLYSNRPRAAGAMTELVRDQVTVLTPDGVPVRFVGLIVGHPDRSYSVGFGSATAAGRGSAPLR